MPTTIDRLKADLQRQIAHIHALQTVIPTLDQLKSKTELLADELRADAQCLPLRILNMLDDCFVDMGWDCKRKQIIDSAKFTAAGLLKSLEELLNEVNNFAPHIDPTDDELSSFSLACSRLWDLDTNRLVPGRDYHLDLQHGKKIHDSGDAARLPLFAFVDEMAFERPTYKAFLKLFDNYSECARVAEVVTKEELAENKVSCFSIQNHDF